MLIGGMGFKKGSGASPYVWSAGPTGVAGNVWMVAGASLGLSRPYAARDTSGNWRAVHSYGTSNLGLDVRYGNSTGTTVQFARKLTAAATCYATGVGVDNLGNANTYAFGNGTDKGVVAKYDYAGAIQWQKKITIGSGANYVNAGFLKRIAPNSYAVVGGYCVASPSYSYVACFDESGALRFKLAANQASQNTISSVAAIPDYTRNVFGVFGTENNAGGKKNAFASLMDYTGAVAWIKRMDVAADVFGVQGAVDILGGVVFAYMYDYAGNYRMNVVSLDSSGVLRWQKQFAHSVSSLTILGVACDANKNTFVLYDSYSPTVEYLGVIKLDENGAIVWNHKVSHASTNLGGVGSLVYDVEYGNLVMAAPFYSSPNSSLIISFPSGAGLTAGNHTLNSKTFVFANADVQVSQLSATHSTVASSQIVWADASLTIADAGMTEAASTDYAHYQTAM